MEDKDREAEIKKALLEKLLELEKSVENNNYKSKVSELLREVLNIEKRDGDAEILIIFLNFILDNYNINNLSTTKISVINKQALESISQRVKLNPFTCIQNELNSLNLPSEIAMKIAQIYNSIYRFQHIFLLFQNFYYFSYLFF